MRRHLTEYQCSGETGAGRGPGPVPGTLKNIDDGVDGAGDAGFGAGNWQCLESGRNFSCSGTVGYVFMTSPVPELWAST
jgi:hypothetical protein